MPMLGFVHALVPAHVHRLLPASFYALLHHAPLNPRGCTHGRAQLDGAVAMLRERDYACIDASSRSVILRFLVEEFMHTPLQLVR